MPLLTATVIPSHPEDPSRPAVLVVGTAYGSPVVSKVSKRVHDVIVLVTITAKIPGGRGFYAKDVRVTWGMDYADPEDRRRVLGLARAAAKRHGGIVRERRGSEYVDV